MRISIFSVKESDEIIKLYETAGYVSKITTIKMGKKVVDFIISEDLVKLGNKERLERLYNELLNKRLVHDTYRFLKSIMRKRRDVSRL